MRNQRDRRARIRDLGFDYTRQPKEPVSRCNLCGATRFATAAQKDRYGFDAATNACLRCGLVFLNPVMTSRAYRDFYARTYRPLLSAYYGRTIDARTIQAEQEGYAEQLAALLAPVLGAAGGTHLDVGGSTGVVARRLADEFKLDSAVLDPSPEELVEASRQGLNTIQGFVEEVLIEPGSYDVVTLCQTVDHLLDIAATLDKIRDATKPTGVLFIDIVDFRAGYLRSGNIEAVVKIDHPYYLTESTMEAYLVRHGLEPLQKDCARDRLHVGYICRLADRQPTYLPSQERVDAFLREICVARGRCSGSEGT